MDDPVEAFVAQALDEAGVPYRRDAPLDFECDTLGVAIECKRMFSPRINKQIEGRYNVIVIQGLEAAKLFRDFVNGRYANVERPERQG